MAMSLTFAWSLLRLGTPALRQSQEGYDTVGPSVNIRRPCLVARNQLGVAFLPQDNGKLRRVGLFHINPLLRRCSLGNGIATGGKAMLRFAGIVIGLSAVLFGLPCLAAASKPVASVEAITGKVLINRGQGFKEISGSAQANTGDQVMVQPGGRGKVLYTEGCMVDVLPGAVIGIAGSCKVAMAKPMTRPG
jgi:hypothetical protein